jgi:hypothetical protein
MPTNRLSVALLIVLLSYSVGLAQTPDPSLAGEPATPTTLIERPEVRIVRVDILPNSTRSMHSHPDMIFHVFVTMDAPIILTIKGQEDKPVRLGPWQTHFFTGGTVHSITNPNPTKVQFMEYFTKRMDAAPAAAAPAR